MSRHYTAIIRIMGVDKPDIDPSRRLSPSALAIKSDEQKGSREVVSLTIRADSIAELVLKAQAHLALVEDTDG